MSDLIQNTDLCSITTEGASTEQTAYFTDVELCRDSDDATYSRCRAGDDGAQKIIWGKWHFNFNTPLTNLSLLKIKYGYAKSGGAKVHAIENLSMKIILTYSDLSTEEVYAYSAHYAENPPQSSKTFTPADITGAWSDVVKISVEATMKAYGTGHTDNLDILLYTLAIDGNVYEASPFKLRNGATTVTLAMMDADNSSPLRFKIGSTVKQLVLVDVANSDASAFRIKTDSGIKAIAKMPT